MKKSILTIVLIAYSIIAFAQPRNLLIKDSLQRLNSKDSLIIWDKNRKLSLTDFLGFPDSTSDGNAETSFGILPIYNADSPFVFDVISIFIKNESWIKRNISDTNTIIHEQGHFDIAEIFARKMKKKIAKLKYVEDSMGWKIYYIHLITMNEVIKFQNKYDLETNHSRNKQKQQNWNNKIQELLNE